MHSHFQSEFSQLNNFPNFSAEEICLTCFEDGGWYRAQCIAHDDASIFLLLIDFGNVYTTTVAKIMPLPAELKEPPPRTHVVSVQDSDKKKASEIETYNKYRFKVASLEDGMYNLVFA